MSFTYQDNQLFAEQVAVADIAKQYSTPCYIYSRQKIEQQWHAFDNAFKTFPHQICYAVKANSNIGLLNLLARLGSGFDIVSGGELMRVIKAGGDAKKTVFSGVGKSTAEITQALELNIGCFNVESPEELLRIEQIGKQLNKLAPIALRVNPNIDAGTHPYISTGLKENKFGIAQEDIISLYQYANTSDYLTVKGMACHIGSQLTEVAPYLEALDKLLSLVDTLAEQQILLEHLDLGGGFGVRYQNETIPDIAAFGKAIIEKIQNRQFRLILEPGRAIVAEAGILLTKVEYCKHTDYKNFLIVDAAMNDLIRPALYEAWQEIIPVILKNSSGNKSETKSYDVVGPVCETGDFLGKDRLLALESNDLLAILTAGAYGFSMSSNYNTRPRAAEIMVDGKQTFLIRERETVEELLAKEKLLPL